MSPPAARPIVHVELHTANLPRACGFYTQLLGWRAETIHAGTNTYLALSTGGGVQAGVAESDVRDPFWLPYVEVADVYQAVSRAECLGASVPVGPHQGPAGWWAAIRAPDGSALGLWTPRDVSSG